VDLILVNVNPAFQEKELSYCIKKVGVKTLIMSESFKESNYVKIIQEMIPETKNFPINTFDLGKLKEYPTLRNLILLNETKV
jgi:fatty-acyl-CoA synthase